MLEWNVERYAAELFFMMGTDVKLFLWQMREAHHLLALQMAEQPAEVDYYASIDPYCFMEKQGYS